MRSVFVLAVAASLAACSSDADETTYTFKDLAGRTCTIGRSSQRATCDKAPTKTCAAEAYACQTVLYGQVAGSDGIVGGPSVQRLCEACCKDSSASTTTADCVPIVCTTPTDCPEPNNRCVDARCVR